MIDSTRENYDVVYKLTCALCNACWTGETRSHSGTRTCTWAPQGKSTSRTFTNIWMIPSSKEACSIECFEIIDKGSHYGIQIKEAMHIKWELPLFTESTARRHLDLTITIYIHTELIVVYCFLFLCLFVVFFLLLFLHVFISIPEPYYTII